MWRAHIVSGWVGTGAAPNDPVRPALVDSDLSFVTMSDVTGQEAAQLVPDPNVCVIAVTCATEVDLDAIVAAGYTELYREEV